MKPAGESYSPPVARPVCDSVCNTCEEAGEKVSLLDRSSCTANEPASALARLSTRKLTGTVSPHAAVWTPSRNDAPARSD